MPRPELTAEEQGGIGSVVFILCIHRQLADPGSLRLNKFEYRHHIDVDSPIKYPTDADAAETKAKDAHPSKSGHHHLGVVEAFARYGGAISNPHQIYEDITISVRLDNQSQLMSDYPKYQGAAASAWSNDRIKSRAGVFDDPFIFPAFSEQTWWESR